MTTPDHQLLAPAYFEASAPDFLAKSDNEVLGEMARSSAFPLTTEAIGAWSAQLPIIREAVAGLEGVVFLEFDIPRLGSRVDCVLVSGAAVIPMEFKVGARHYNREDYNQSWDYGLDLKNFHRASHSAAIFPILICTAATTSDSRWREPHRDDVYPPAKCNASGVRALVQQAVALATGAAIDGPAWGRSPYQPTPTIVEAAQALYARHSVEAIARHDAGAQNLSVTSFRVEQIVDDAAQRGRKAIVFVTGVPGAGKTLVGLNVATRRRDRLNQTHAVFLSGNVPLVRVLREALVRDEHTRQAATRAKPDRERKGAIANRVEQFIQSVHHWRDDGLRNSGAPDDHVVIFDEAQRAWDRQKTADFMRRKRGLHDFSQSEPEFLLNYMNRRQDWAVVICLVGGGQEIYDGEAGIGGWLDAVAEHFAGWDVYISPSLADSEYTAESAIANVSSRAAVNRETDLHLKTSMRSFRAENVSAFVRQTLDLELSQAAESLRQMDRYPLALTRDLAAAKSWIRANARGSERFGLVASSSAKRLKPYAVDVRVEVDPVHWFLNDATDTRSSFYLEDAATEFQVQGLELDWICMNWDADLRRHGDGWNFNEFRVDGWRKIRQERRQRYLLNAYRVLLTRARQGMVIFVPEGSKDDPTRRAEYYDETYSYLAKLGIAQV
ncbi:MAG TPA: DUF2075 domain-containing protein [Gemmatimonadaceae bacterium]|jgi:hypothetical protein